MPNDTKAVLVGLNVFLATNNVRRNIGAFAANVPNANGAVSQIAVTVLANGDTYSFAALSGNLITVVSVGSALSANVTFAGGGGFVKTVTSLLVLDMEVASIVFTNQSPTINATLVIVSG